MKTVMTHLVILTLIGVLPCMPPAAGAARLEGRVLGVDSRPASGFTVHLIDPQGAASSRALTSEGGLYSFPGLPAGSYTIGIESPEGGVAPVASAPVRLRDGELARRDLKLYEADAETQNGVARANYGFLTWWHGLDRWAKTGFLVGVFIGGVIVVKSFDSSGSPSTVLEETVSSGSEIGGGSN